MFIIPSNTKVTVFTPSDLDPRGVCIRIKFSSGRVISIIKHKYSYGGDSGLWEYMILEDESYFTMNKLDYNPEPVGYQTDEDIQKVLEELACD